MKVELNETKVDYERLCNSKITFRRGSKSKSVYHYTSISGLQGILEHKTLRFTNIKYMNDKDEIIAGIESTAKVLNIAEEDREKMRSEIMNGMAQTFVCCFSLEEDSLPMWNYYTKEINNQGYNIEFDDKKLVESILRNNPALNGCDFAFGNVDYSTDNDSEYSKTITSQRVAAMCLTISKIARAVIKEADAQSQSDKTKWEAWEEEINNEGKKQKASNLPIYFYNGKTCNFEKNPSGDYWYFIKRDWFKQEKEFRIAITVPNELLPELVKAGVYKFRVSNGVLVPYIELKFSEDVVKGITISPTVQSDLVELSIRQFMEYCMFDIADPAEFIKHSKVPVRF